jgi:3D (Asp-Asp-Asp) domain-containing protein
MHSSGFKNYRSTALALFSSLLFSGLCLQAQSVSTTAKPADTQSVSVASASTSARADEAVPAEPKISLQHPSLNPEITVSPNRLASTDVAPSDSDQEFAPRNFKATAYSLRGRTRSGVYVRRGVIAADPRVLPLGTVVQLKAGNNYSGVYTVHDTGGAIKGRIIDIWMPSSREARRFGRQRVKLVVLQYPRGRKAAPARKK